MRKKQAAPGCGMDHDNNFDNDIEDKIKISILISSVYYFLDYVFIMSEGDGFWLVVIHNKQCLTYKKYKTIKGARIAFTRYYNSKVWKAGIKPNWSVFYCPTVDWLEERREIISKHGEYLNN